MAKRIENFLKNLSLEELREVRNMSEHLINIFEDGFEYECKVRSYGRNWTMHMKNALAVEELCYQYGGDDGIVDVYTNNPDLRISNYGEVYYFPTMEAASKWRDYMYIKSNIDSWKSEWELWDKRDELPFRARPTFGPYISREEIADYEKQIVTDESTIIMPTSLQPSEEENC